MIRLYVRGPLAVGTDIELDEARSHYLGRVMRRTQGDPVELFDGQSGSFAGQIASFDKRGAHIMVVEAILPMPERGMAPILFQAVIKRPRFEWLVEKATELAVGGIVPVRSRRVAVPLGRADRLDAIAVEAAEQSGRLDVPAIAVETPLAGIQALRRPGVPLLVLDPDAADAAIDIVEAAGGDVDLLVGPEGGLAPEDDALIATFDRVRRGRIAATILRAETAAIAGLAAVALVRSRPPSSPLKGRPRRVEPVQKPR